MSVNLPEIPEYDTVSDSIDSGGGSTGSVSTPEKLSVWQKIDRRVDELLTDVRINKLITKIAFHNQFSEIKHREHLVKKMIADLSPKSIKQKQKPEFVEFAKKVLVTLQKEILTEKLEYIDDDDLIEITPANTTIMEGKEKLESDKEIDELRGELDLIAEQKKSLEEKIENLLPKEKLRIAVSVAAAKTSLVSTLLMRLKINPATTIHSFDALHGHDRAGVHQVLSQDEADAEIQQFKEARATIRNDIRQQHARRFPIYTEDHQQLDGCIIYPSDQKTQGNRRVMIMTPPSGGNYELLYEEAKKYASKYQINVVLFNSRGVGYSLGSAHSTQDIVTDCKAAITYTLKEYCTNDPEQLCVWGHCFGAGATAAALDTLKKEGELQGDVGLYINLHSFKSLHRAGAGIIGRCEASISQIVKNLFQLIGLNTLNTKKIIDELPAKNIVIVSSKVGTEQRDDLLGTGALGHNLINTSEKIKQLKSCFPHLESSSYIEVAVADAMAMAADKEAQRDFLEYHKAIGEWAKTAPAYKAKT